jgi:hypothetical protein
MKAVCFYETFVSAYKSTNSVETQKTYVDISTAVGTSDDSGTLILGRRKT